jgi:hypothetical protein
MSLLVTVWYGYIIYWADIQRRGSILAWITIWSGTDKIAEVMLLISPFLR